MPLLVAERARTASKGLRSGKGFNRPLYPRWRGGRVVEGAPLLRAYTLTRIEGSNPFLSATRVRLVPGLSRRST